MDGFVATGLSIEDLVTFVAMAYTMDSGPMPTLTGPQPDTGGHVSGASSPASTGPYNQNAATLPDTMIKDCRTAPCPKPAGPASSPTVEPDGSSSIHEVVPIFGLAVTLSSPEVVRRILACDSCVVWYSTWVARLAIRPVPAKATTAERERARVVSPTMSLC